MPEMSMHDLGQTVNVGDTVLLKVKAINGDKVEFDYDNINVEPSAEENAEPQIDKEMTNDQMNDPKMLKKMDSMSSDQMKKVLPKKVY